MNSSNFIYQVKSECRGKWGRWENCNEFKNLVAAKKRNDDRYKIM